MWHGPGRRIDGLNFQEGVVVIWADQVAFLPTRPEKHLGAELAWSSAGFISLRGKEASYDLAGLWSQGPEHFEAEVAKVARDRMSKGDCEVVGTGKARFFRRGEEQLLAQFVIPDEAIDGWTIGKAEFDAKGLAKVMGVISFFPALFATICGLVAFFGDDKSVYWGIPFWGILVVFAWGGYVVAYLRHKREQA